MEYPGLKEVLIHINGKMLGPDWISNLESSGKPYGQRSHELIKILLISTKQASSIFNRFCKELQVIFLNLCIVKIKQKSPGVKLK